LKLFKSYEKAQEEVEKLRQQLYPKLGEGEGEMSTIMENESDTSEAIIESDDEIKPRSEADEFPEEEVSGHVEDFDAKSQDNKKPEKTDEDLEFEAMFDKMATDSYQERIKELPKVTTRDVPVPMSTKTVKKTYEQLQVVLNFQ
jgi:hypothetical protein